MNGNNKISGSAVDPADDNSSAAKDFLDRFCVKFGCLRQKFETRFLLECVFPEARDIARVINILYPRYFQADYAMIEDIKHTTSFAEFKKLVEFHGAQNKKIGLFRTILKARVSKGRLLNLGRALFETEKAESPDPRTSRSVQR